MNYKSVCFCCDRRYYEHVVVAIQSLLSNSFDINIIVYIINDDFEQGEIEYIKRIIKKYRQEFIYIDEIKLDCYDLKTTEQFSKAIYYRLLIPHLIKDDFVLYLDSDVVINSCLSDIFEINLKNNVIGAVEDIGYSNYSVIGMNEESAYFNSGVMLINLNLWRDQNITERAMKLLLDKNNEFKYPDQDALNIILQYKWLRLNPKYNQQASFFYSSNREKGWKSFGDLFSIAKTNPTIIHYSGGRKPWHTTSNHPFKSRYWHYYSMTDIYNPRFKDFSKINYFKYLVKFTFSIKS